MKTESEVRVTKIKAFTECHRYAAASLAQSWDGRLHVGTWIGSTVNGLMGGYPAEPKPDSMSYDRITSSAARADESVAKIMTAIGEFEAETKPEYLHRNLPVSQVYEATKISAVIDAVAEIGKETVLLNVSTSRQPYAAWIQLAMQGWLAGADRGIEVDLLALLHVPRVGPRTDQKRTYDVRPFSSFGSTVIQWAYTLNEARSTDDWNRLTATPGMHCARCAVEDCAVRALPPKE